MTLNMNAAYNPKPPRPCTEYNIFFQLERAYILQVLLDSPPPPPLDPSDVFRTSQPSYAGLPPLPARYASLVLPYDWHLPGKEKRRKRKHRKSHGVIGFHDLSARIVEAWRGTIGREAKAYCEVVSAAGMDRYKAAMKEWKKRGGGGGREAAATNESRNQRDRPREGPTAPVPDAIRSRDDENVARNGSGSHDALRTLLDELEFPTVAHDEGLVPASAASGAAVAMDEMDRAFENDFPLLGAWDAPEGTTAPHVAPSADAVPSANHVLLRGCQAGGVENHRPRNSFLVSNDAVDMDDGEIFAMWNKEDAAAAAVGRQDRGEDGKLDQTFLSLFGSKGYHQTMHDMQRMKELMDLEAKISKLQRMKGCPRPRRRSVVACSA